MTEGGLTAQIKVLIAEIKAKSLVKALNTKDFATFARRYNGASYAQNQYDTRMAAAFKRWSRKLETVTTRVAQPAYQSLSKRQIELVQTKLVQLGYTMVGRVDGKWGTNTTAAMNAFQAYEGLPETGDFDEASKSALATAQPKLVDEDRANATVDDLRGTSRTVDTAEKADALGSAKKWIGGVMVAGGSAEKEGRVHQQDAVRADGHGLHRREPTHEPGKARGEIGEPLLGRQDSRGEALPVREGGIHLRLPRGCRRR